MKAEEQRATYTATQASAPTEWPKVPFEQVATPQSDRGKRIKQRDYLPEGRIPVIDQGQSLIGGYTNDGDFAFLGELPVILFGDHTRAVKLVDHRFAVGADGIKIFRPAEGVRPKYLYYWMKSARIPDRGYGRHYQYLRQLSVPLPPPNKQEEIVAEIEKQFSRLDEAVANLKRVKANLKRYKAAVLKAAVEGRLVETEAERARREGRSYDTGAQLLQRILETRRSQWKGKGKYKEPAAPDTTDLPELPEGWGWANCGAVLSDIEAGASFKCIERPPVEDETGVLKVSAVTWGTFNELESKTCSDPDRIEEDYLVRQGDFLFSRANTIDLVGACVIVHQVSKRLMLSDKTLRFRVSSSVSEHWLLTCLRSKFGRDEIERLATGNQESMRNIGQERIRQIRMPLPPLAEQLRIVAEVGRCLTLLSGTEAQAEANLQRAERLRQSILQRGFSGRGDVSSTRTKWEPTK